MDSLEQQVVASSLCCTVTQADFVNFLTGWPLLKQIRRQPLDIDGHLAGWADSMLRKPLREAIVMKLVVARQFQHFGADGYL